MSSEEKDVPQNTQDLTVFVQNLLQQMVRRPRARAACRPRARRGCAAHARTGGYQPRRAELACAELALQSGSFERQATATPSSLGMRSQAAERLLRALCALPSGITSHPLVLAATTIPRHVGRHHPAKYACALACARTICPLAMEPVLPRKAPAVDLRRSASLQLARAAESAALSR